MKLLVIIKEAYPIGPVTSKRVHQICKGLVSSNYNVNVCIANPTENANSIRNTSAVGTIDTINYFHIASNHIRHTNIFIRKFIDYISYTKVILLCLFSKKYKQVLIIGPSMDFRILLPIICKIRNIKSVLEINEYPFIDERNGISTKIRRWIYFNWVIPWYDGFIVISDPLTQIITKYKSKTSKIINIPILTEEMPLKVELKASPVNCPYIFHAGSLFENKDAVSMALKAFSLAKAKIPFPIKFVFTGNIEKCPDRELIKKVIVEEGLINDVVFTGYLIEKDLAWYFKFASFAVVNKTKSIQNMYCFATKLSDYISYDVPIITTDFGESSKYLIHDFNSIVVEPENLEQLSDAIALGFSNPEKLKEYANNAKKLIQMEFNYDFHGKKLAEFFRNL